FEACTSPFLASCTAPLALHAAYWMGYFVSITPLAIATMISSLALSILQHEKKEALDEYLFNETLRFIIAVPITATLYAHFSGVALTMTALSHIIPSCAIGCLIARIAFLGFKKIMESPALIV
ncbi:MAG: hypothetical protein JWO53_609, partial [Chlamydiia bacterium]|nr:hypothetical protein [Chlamydiia bacterium]